MTFSARTEGQLDESPKDNFCRMGFRGLEGGDSTENYVAATNLDFFLTLPRRAHGFTQTDVSTFRY